MFCGSNFFVLFQQSVSRGWNSARMGISDKIPKPTHPTRFCCCNISWGKLGPDSKKSVQIPSANCSDQPTRLMLTSRLTWKLAKHSKTDIISLFRLKTSQSPICNNATKTGIQFIHAKAQHCWNGRNMHYNTFNDKQWIATFIRTQSLTKLAMGVIFKHIVWQVFCYTMHRMQSKAVAVFLVLTLRENRRVNLWRCLWHV